MQFARERRPPARLPETALELFTSTRNLTYLQTMRPASAAMVRDFAAGVGRDIADSDPLAQRGSSSNSAAATWATVRQLNGAFLKWMHSRDNDVRRAGKQYITGEVSNNCSANGVSVAATGDANESYQMRAFESDSLSLNANGSGATSYSGSSASSGAGSGVIEFSNYDVSDQPWDTRGRAGRSAAEAMAEYWGEERSASTVAASARSLGAAYSNGATSAIEWSASNSGSGEAASGGRVMRETGIPRRQKTGQRQYETDIVETFNSSARETEGQVRGWGSTAAIANKTYGNSYMK
jgi:hypothetical protein